MILSYLKIALRCLLKQKYSTFVNIFGLAFGLACGTLLFLWVYHEYNYDRFHDEYKQIYRVGLNYKSGNFESQGIVTMATLGPALSFVAPEMESFIRTTREHSFHVCRPNSSGVLIDQPVTFADSSFFQIFSFELIKGNPKTVLSKPYSAVITQEIADKLFPDENPIGKLLQIETKTFVVTGLAATPPSATHFTFSILASFESLYTFLYGETLTSWRNFNSRLYVKLKEETKPADFIKTINQVIESYMDVSVLEQVHFDFFLQPVHAIHTDPDIEGGYKDNLSRKRLLIFFLASTMLLIVAGINYVMHSLARSSLRLKEIGIRKVLGADRNKIIVQFIGESILATFIASALALSLIELLLPTFNTIFDVDVMNIRNSFMYFGIGFTLFVIILGFLAGFFPALYFSKILPRRVMQEPILPSLNRLPIRNVMVIFQIVIALGIFICATIISKQFRMIETKALGFSTENRIYIPLESNHLRQSYVVFKDELNKLPGVIQVAGSDKIPGTNFSSNPVSIENNPDRISIARHEIDQNYLDLMGINVVEGRGFNPELSTDVNKVLVNHTFVKHFGWDNPVGRRINRIRGEPIPYNIIGVVNDYHFKSLHEPIEPLIIYLKNYSGYFITILLADTEPKVTIDRIKKVWESFFPSDPFVYNHLDRAFEPYYHSEKNLKKVINFLTVLIVLLSILGIFGLVHLDTVSRTKEVGIKKVFGATSWNIIAYFVIKYGIYVGIACIIAFPVVFLLMSRWLDTFTYRISIFNPIIFIVPAILFFIVIIATVAFQIIRISQTNPVEALRYE